MSSISSLSAIELLDGMEKKDFSSVEVVEDFLNRAHKYEALGAYLSTFPEEALEKAKKADSLRSQGNAKPLLGLPIAIKDLFAYDSGTTTCASRILEDYQSPYTASCVKRLTEAGAVVIGKTNMDEFAMGSSTENSAYEVAKNPWNPETVPGGSSGGSAVAVAGRLAPISLGTDTGGSIRQPSAFCGTSGLKPTYGRVSRYGLVAYASSLDQAGPIAQSVEDCAVLSESLFGYDTKDSTSVKKEVGDFQKDCRQPMEGVRVGVPKEYFVEGLQPDVEKAVREALAQLESLGATLVEISLPHTEFAIPTYYIVACAEASSNLSRYDGVRYGKSVRDGGSLEQLYSRSRSQGFGTEVKRRILMGTFVLSSGYYDAYYIKAQKVRSLIQQDFQRAFASDCDCIVCPTAPTTAFQIGSQVDDPMAMYLGDILTVSANLAGIPAMSIPCGFDQSGLPIGLQLMAKPWDESTLFRVGGAYQKETNWHQQTATEGEAWNTKA